MSDKITLTPLSKRGLDYIIFMLFFQTKFIHMVYKTSLINHKPALLAEIRTAGFLPAVVMVLRGFLGS